MYIYTHGTHILEQPSPTPIPQNELQNVTCESFAIRPLTAPRTFGPGLAHVVLCTSALPQCIHPMGPSHRSFPKKEYIYILYLYITYI